MQVAARSFLVNDASNIELISPRAAAAPAYLDRRSRRNTRDLLKHACLRGRFPSGRMLTWEFERNGKVVRLDAAITGTGIIYHFEDWLRPHLDAGVLESVVELWWPTFSRPLLFYPGRRLVPAPLRAFIQFIKAQASRVHSLLNIAPRDGRQARHTETAPAAAQLLNH